MDYLMHTQTLHAYPSMLYFSVHQKFFKEFTIICSLKKSFSSSDSRQEIFKSQLPALLNTSSILNSLSMNMRYIVLRKNNFKTKLQSQSTFK